MGIASDAIAIGFIIDGRAFSFRFDFFPPDRTLGFQSLLVSSPRDYFSCRYLVATLMLLAFGIAAPIAVGQTIGPEVEIDREVEIGREFGDEVIRSAFKAAHQGFSSDEVLTRQALRDDFIAAIESSLRRTLTPDERTDAWWRLLNLRKAGKLNIPTTRRGQRTDPGMVIVAEIAARVVMDRHHVTSDQLLVSDRYRGEIKIESQKLDPSVDIDAVAKAILSLRKKRVLRPELVLTVADWGRTVETFGVKELIQALAENQIPHHPGVYSFRDASGYLYIGEASDLVTRLNEHLGGSDRESLANHLAGEAEQTSVELHIFSPDSPARKVAMRRAYESEMIRSRNPRFNLRP